MEHGDMVWTAAGARHARTRLDLSRLAWHHKLIEIDTLTFSVSSTEARLWTTTCWKQYTTEEEKHTHAPRLSLSRSA